MESKTAGRKAAEAIEESGLGIGSFEKLPDSQDELVEGQYYIKKDGSIRRFDGKKLLTPSIIPLTCLFILSTMGSE